MGMDLAAGGTPRPSPAPAGPEVSPATPAAPAACLLAPGDSTDLRVDVLDLETKAGNQVVIGTAEAWRLKPAPETLLFGGPFRSELSQVTISPPPREPGWGGGIVGSVGTGGTGLGAVLAFPPVRVPLLGWRLEATAAATFIGDQRFIGQAVFRP